MPPVTADTKPTMTIWFYKLSLANKMQKLMKSAVTTKSDTGIMATTNEAEIVEQLILN